MEPTYRSSLLNRTQLTTSSFHFPPAVTEYKDEFGHIKYKGYEVEIAKIISEMLEVGLKISTPPDGHRWGVKLSNGSFTGIKRLLQEKSVDLVFGVVWCSVYYSEVGKCSSTYDNSYLLFAVPFSPPISLLQAMVRPFHALEWMLLVLSAVLVSVVYVIASGDYSAWLGFIALSLGVSGNFRSYSRQFKYASGILLFFWLYYTIVISTAYRSVMTSLLSAVIRPFSFNSVRAIAQSDFIWGGTEDGPSVLGGYKGSEYQILLDKYIVFPYSITSLSRMVKEGNMAVLESHVFLEYQLNSKFTDEHGGPLFHIIRQPVLEYNVVFYVPLDSTLLPYINKLISRITQSGIFQFWYFKYMHEEKRHRISSKRRRIGSSSFVKILMSFIPCGGLLGFGSLICEILYHKIMV